MNSFISLTNLNNIENNLEGLELEFDMILTK